MVEARTTLTTAVYISASSERDNTQQNWLECILCTALRTSAPVCH
jgi:hypothetical protein